MKKKILFVCKHNRFRSKVAEAIFKILSKNKVKSRGTEPDYLPVAENVQKAIKNLGYEKVDKTPKILEKKDWEWADLIVVVADNVNLKGKKVRKWDIPDTNQRNKNRIFEISKKIEKRVKKLVEEL